MINDSLRLITVLIAKDPCPVAYVQILQIGKVHLVKIADLLEDFSPVDGRSGAGEKDPPRFFIVFIGLVFSSCEGPAQSAVEIAAVVHL